MSLRGVSQVSSWVFYVVMTTLNAPSGAQAVTMLSRGQVYVLNSGQSVQLECEFLGDNFNLFDNPMLWTKIRKNERTLINMMGHLLEPYRAPGRYRLTFTFKRPPYRLTLSLLNVSLEDSGNYTCEVGGHGLTVLATVTHSVFVRGVTMLSRGQTYVLDAGQSVQLECEFLADNFNLFDNPMIWRKFQKSEQTQVNVMGNIIEPYLETGRYDVTFTSDWPRYGFTLSVLNVSLEDSGNYTCEVRGQGLTVLATVTHSVFVRGFEPSIVASHLIRNGLNEPEVKKIEPEQEPKSARKWSRILDDRSPGVATRSSVSMATLFTFTLGYITSRY